MQASKKNVVKIRTIEKIGKWESIFESLWSSIDRWYKTLKKVNTFRENAHQTLPAVITM